MALTPARTEGLYYGDGSSVGPYVLEAQVDIDTDLVVTIDGVVTTAYTVAGIGAGGNVSVTFDAPVASLAEIVIARMTPYDRTRYDYTIGQFRPDTVDADLNRLGMQSQQLATALLRVPQAKRGHLELDLKLNPEASRLLSWSGDGLALVNVDPATVTPASVVFTTIGRELATAADEAAARTSIDAIGPTDLTLALNAQWYGNRNRLLNSDFRVHQRVDAITVAAAALLFGADMWQCRSGAAPSGTLAIAQVAATTPGEARKALRMSRTVGTYAGALIAEQVLEPDDIWDLAGKTITVQAKVRKGAAFAGTAVRLVVVYSTSASQGYANLAAGAWANMVSLNAVTLPLASLTTSYQVIGGQVVLPSTAKDLALRVEVVGFTGSGAANDFLEVTDLGLAEEATLSTYLRRPYVEELMRCRRWYETSFNPGDRPSAPSTAGAIHHRAQGVGTLLDTLRAQYTCEKARSIGPTWYSTVTGAANTVRDTSAGVDVATSGAVNTGLNNTGMPTVAATVAGHLYEAHWVYNGNF